MLCETPLDLSWRPGKLAHVLRQGQGEGHARQGPQGIFGFGWHHFQGYVVFCFTFAYLIAYNEGEMVI